MRASSASRPISGSIFPAAARATRSAVNSASGSFFERAPRRRPPPRCRRPTRHRRPTPPGSVGDLGDAVGDVAHHVETGDALLLQQVGGVAVRLAEDRHQNVAPEDLVLAGRLDVRRGALDDALEAERLLRGHVAPLGKRSTCSSRKRSRARFRRCTSPPHWRMMSATSIVVQQSVEQVLDATGTRAGAGALRLRRESK